MQGIQHCKMRKAILRGFLKALSLRQAIAHYNPQRIYPYTVPLRSPILSSTLLNVRLLPGKSVWQDILLHCCEAVRRAATLIITQESLHVGSLCTVYGGKNGEFEHTLSVVPDFSEDSRNMVGQRTFSVVQVFGQCSESAQ